MLFGGQKSPKAGLAIEATNDLGGYIPLSIDPLQLFDYKSRLFTL